MQQHNVSVYRRVYGFTTFMGLLIMAMVLYWCIYYRGGFSFSFDSALQFNWHPFLMILGMIMFASHSMLYYRTSRELPIQILKTGHTIIHFSAFACSLIGLMSVFAHLNYYSDPPKPNLESWHTWFGIATIVMFALQFSLGISVFLNARISKELRKTIRPFHVAFGVAIFFMAMVAASTGFTQLVKLNSPALDKEGRFVNFIEFSLLMYTILVINLVTEARYKRIPLPTEQPALDEQEQAL